MAVFIEHPKIEELAEKHAKDVGKLTEDEQKRVLKAYKGVRQDLRDRLDYLSPKTFTAQRARSVMIQINEAIESMNDDMFDVMKGSAHKAAELGIKHLITEVNEWDDYFMGASSGIDIDLVVEATDVTKLLIENYQASLNTYSESVRAKLARGISDGIISGVSSHEIVSRIGNEFLGEEWRLQRVVRTELMGVYSRGKIRGLQRAADDIPDLKKTVYNPMDSRTANDSKYVQKEVDAEDPHLIVDIDDYFEYKWRGKTRKYFAPPDRPNDRSILIPYRPGWDKQD